MVATLVYGTWKAGGFAFQSKEHGVQEVGKLTSSLAAALYKFESACYSLD